MTCVPESSASAAVVAGEEGLLAAGMAIRCVALVNTSTAAFSCWNSSLRTPTSLRGTAEHIHSVRLKIVYGRGTV